MRVGLTLRPGQRGTKRLTSQYGAQLVCVRYRYDAAQKKRYKTVELIVDVQDWAPPAAPIAPNTMVSVRIGLHETQLQRRVREAGGYWNLALKLWALRYDKVVALGLIDRIVPDAL